jgi:glycosyltransferase involved in cell wall biosynthesis
MSEDRQGQRSSLRYRSGLRRPRLLGILPPLGGSLSALARQGQLERLLDYYLPAYLAEFDRVRYFSYEPERLADFSSDRDLLSRVELLAPPGRIPRHAWALVLGVGYRRRLQECSVLRALQALGALPAAVGGVPVMCTYGYDYAAFSRGALVRAKRAAIGNALGFVLSRAAVTVVTTAAGEAEARAYGARRIEHIPNGVDVELFAPRDTRAVYDVVYVGQLVPRKNVRLLVDAMAGLERDLRLCIVGAGPEETALRAASAKAGVRTTFLGVCPNTVVTRVLAQSRSFVLPSAAEGHPKAVLEALAAGVPTITTDLPGVQDLVHDGAVITFRRGDRDDLRKALLRVLDDHDLSRRLATIGRRVVVERFNLRSLLERETAMLIEIARGD